MKDLLLILAFYCLGFVMGAAGMFWFWVNHNTKILDRSMEDILKRNGLVREGYSIRIKGEDAL